MANQLTDESQQMVDWRQRHFVWLADRIAGTQEDKEQFFEMWFEALRQSFYEGTMEAKGLVDRMAEGITEPVHLSFVAKQIEKLASMNRDDVPPLDETSE